MAVSDRPSTISFEEFASTTLRAVKATLDSKPGGPPVFWDPEIICGIVIRPPRDYPRLETLGTQVKTKG